MLEILNLSQKKRETVPNNLMKWLKTPSPLQPLYYVIGSESFFVSEIKKTFMINAFFKNGAEAFNHNEVDAGKISVGDLMTLIETLPFMSKKRLIFCNEAERFSDQDWDKLEPLLNHPIPSTILVYFFEKKDGRKKHFKLLKEKAVSLSAESIRSWEIEIWVDFISRKEAVEFSFDSKILFSHLVGTNLMEIQLELKKLKQYVGEGKKVSEKDVLSCTSRLKTDSIFDFTDAIGKKDIIRALSSMAHLLEHNQNEIGALAMVARHIRILSKLQEGKKQNLSKSQLAHKAGVSPYFLNSYLNQIPLWSEQQIHQTMEALFEADKALKSSLLSSHIWLENFILKTCS